MEKRVIANGSSPTPHRARGRSALHAGQVGKGQPAAGCLKPGLTLAKNRHDAAARGIRPSVDEVLFSYMTPLSKRLRVIAGRRTTIAMVALSRSGRQFGGRPYLRTRVRK